VDGPSYEEGLVMGLSDWSEIRGYLYGGYDYFKEFPNQPWTKSTLHGVAIPQEKPHLCVSDDIISLRSLPLAVSKTCLFSSLTA